MSFQCVKYSLLDKPISEHKCEVKRSLFCVQAEDYEILTGMKATLSICGDACTVDKRMIIPLLGFPDTCFPRLIWETLNVVACVPSSS